MKPQFTPLDQKESYIESEAGKKAIQSLSYFIPKMEEEFRRIKKAVPFELTEEALLKYVDFDGLRPKMQMDINTSGLLVNFDWASWMEGIEILDGIRKPKQINQIKACKLMTIIVKRDSTQSGYFEKEMKKGTFVLLLKNLCQK